MADKPNKADETEVNEADKAKANEANGAIVTHAANEANVAKEANVINKTVAANEADQASLAEAKKSLANCGIAVVVKYSSKLLCAMIPSSFASTRCLNSPSQNIPYLLLK